jgi:hypothetical protein
MATLNPKTFYEWVREVRRLKLYVGPFEGIHGDMVQHALSPSTHGRVSFGLWDHQGNVGFIDMDKVDADKARVIKPAPPIDGKSSEWDL